MKHVSTLSRKRDKPAKATSLLVIERQLGLLFAGKQSLLVLAVSFQEFSDLFTKTDTFDNN